MSLRPHQSLVSHIDQWTRIVGSAKKDHATLRALSALIASLPASENKGFREEFDTEYEDVQLTAYLATLTKSSNILNEVRFLRQFCHDSSAHCEPLDSLLTATSS